MTRLLQADRHDLGDDDLGRRGDRHRHHGPQNAHELHQEQDGEEGHERIHVRR